MTVSENKTAEKKNADTLKAYSDICDDKPEYLFVCSEFQTWEMFTFSGLNECPYRFRPAIAMLADAYAESQTQQLREENQHLKEQNTILQQMTNGGVEALKMVTALKDENARLREELKGIIPMTDSDITPA